MSTFPSFSDPSLRLRFNSAETVAELRKRRADEENERAESRMANLAQLASDLNCAEHRICAWEKMHGLRMPSGSEHPVLAAIAAATRLTLADVQYEQRRRSARTSTPHAATDAR